MTPAHLPERLTISLWDFSWYTRAGAGEPYADLDAAFAETVERGYNAARICAAPLLTFGGLGLDPRIAVSGLGGAPDGGRYGRGTRWYDVPGGYEIDVRERLFELLQAAERHGVVVVLASWEYQQSPAFAATPDWWNAIDAVPLDDRYDVLAASFDRMLAAFDAEGLLESVAFTELHNEVDFSRVPPFADRGARAVEWLEARHPSQLVSASYGKPPHLDMASVSPAMRVAQFHIYTYGVLDALQQRIDLRSEGTAGFPNAELRSLLVDGAPEFADYGRPESWRMDATVITDQMVYGYDFIDPAKWDAWLLEHYPAHRDEMHREMAARITGVAEWARARGVPQVIGEGWIGYTPLFGGFEEGAAGLELAEHGIRTALEAGAWGMVLCSNAAPHHPMWSNIEWQQRMNGEILAHAAQAAV
ncbi:hypothetical protein ABIE21_002825 [Conyzicola nivalis]|uniref:Sugar-binding cellulase-like protein n=1 Tax=Conyzicola nivalis TaxID=1477021 RepID=A0ABV2QQH6_9MICO